MRLVHTLPLLLALFPLPVASTYAAKPDPALERIRQDIFYLAGPECEGRGVYGQGIHRAAEYIANAFKEAGLKPGGPDGSYFQPFSITGSPKLGTPNRLTLVQADGTKKELSYGQEFTPTGMTQAGEASGELVFAGYGIVSKNPTYDDFQGLDIRGKWVILLRKSPRASDPHGPFSPEQQSLLSKVTNAKQRGAIGVIFVNHASDSKDDTLMDFSYAAGASAGVPVLHMKRSILESLLAHARSKLADIEAAIEEDLKPRGRALPGWTAKAIITVERPKIPARNVIGVLEGKGPLADETIIIGAHYDHLGTGEYGSLGGHDAKGRIHYGADDNASGTTGLMELARRFAAIPNRIGRRIVFLAFSGEEIALLGSRHYVNQPVFPLEKTVFMLNMDMIGRMTQVEDDGLPGVKAITGGTSSILPGNKMLRDRLVIYGTGTAEGMDALVDQLTRDDNLKVIKVPAGTGPSDHDSFYRKKIPVLFLFTGTHRDYHRPTDTPEKINLEGLHKVVKVAERIITHFSTQEQRPNYLVAQGNWSDPTDPNPRPSRMNMPKLGIMPGNYESADGGVLVDDVSPGGAAEKAGIRKGDIIIEIAGKPVKNIGAYMTAMAQHKAGIAIDVIVLRKDAKVTLKVTPSP